MDKYLMIWPKSEEVMHINYHYTQFGEYIDYLEKFFPDQIFAIDCDVQDKNVEELIKKNNIKKIIMQVNYENAKNAFEMCNKIKKECDIPILAYGSIPNRLPKLFLNSKFDAIHSQGDAEVCIKSFIRHYEKGDKKNKEQIIGANLIEDEKFISTQSGRYILPDSWGVSKEENVPIEQYDKIKKKNRYVLNMSRGCPFGCSHCLIQLTEGKIERRRSIENTKEAIGKIKDKYKHIKIWAANFTLNKEYVEDFCDMMKNNYPDVTWECATRIDLVRNQEMLDRMHDAGCRQISLGIESLNNKELINTKDFESNEISRAIAGIQNSGMQVKGCIMLGMPNQSKESIINTLQFLKNRKVIIRPTIYTPYQELSDDIELEKLSKYNRKTYENNNVEGVSGEQLLQLVKNPYDFERILQVDNRDDDKTLSIGTDR